MRSLFKRKWKPANPPVAEPPRRDRQQNIKVSEDCSAAFAALAQTYGVSKASLFEDMVAERLETLKRQGVKLAIASA